MPGRPRQESEKIDDMTLDERIDRLVEQNDRTERIVASLAAQSDRTDKQIGVLTERTISAMDAINRLARIADNHEDRISDFEDRKQ